ncbi:hypothetical protein F0L74_16695 [Chitinophaga agrisoli]|uniref:Uncharacterized protein n=1 Tax=Chitinophaga agrisoli TaxID=2607653 RepID=A0A5B2VP86_9BACT|nr:hypothetical protein [Chitinophaga agrisoli]KAA2241533.1 hypothetical protein F0L74_16695 [Chitinophaga agrisoli]
MSQSFRFKYDQMREGDPTQQNKSSENDSYSMESHVRNVCFVWLDGRRVFLNYGYLVSGDYDPVEGRIVLAFTSHVLTLTGIHLESLFYEFMQHVPRQIICTDPRYNATVERNTPTVNEIIIVPV